MRHRDQKRIHEVPALGNRINSETKTFIWHEEQQTALIKKLVLSMSTHDSFTINTWLEEWCPAANTMHETNMLIRRQLFCKALINHIYKLHARGRGGRKRFRQIS